MSYPTTFSVHIFLTYICQVAARPMLGSAEELVQAEEILEEANV